MVILTPFAIDSLKDFFNFDLAKILLRRSSFTFFEIITSRYKLAKNTTIVPILTSESPILNKVLLKTNKNSDRRFITLERKSLKYSFDSEI